jgi:hypothetical protein
VPVIAKCAENQKLPPPGDLVQKHAVQPNTPLNCFTHG